MITPGYSIPSTERVLPRLALDFTTASLDARVTLTRALNTATAINSSGQIAPVNANLPRFDYNLGTGGACKGLLIEETRANLFLNSALAGAVAGSPGTAPTSWAIQFGTSATAALTTSIYGTLDSAQAITFSGTAIRMMYAQTLNVTAGQQYAFSAYLEAVSGNIADFMTVTNGTATVTMNTTVTSPQTAGRYTVLFTASTTGTCNARIGIGTTGATAGAVSATFSRPQVEAGSFSTSYIPTTTTSLTRNADAVSMTGTNFSDWYSSTTGSMLAEWDIPNITGTKCAYYLTNAAETERIRLHASLSNINRYTITSSGTTIVFNTAAATTGVTKSVVGFKASDYAVSFNGAAVATNTTLATVPTTPNQLQIGRDGASAYLNGWMRRVAYWPQRLINSEVQSFAK